MCVRACLCVPCLTVVDYGGLVYGLAWLVLQENLLDKFSQKYTSYVAYDDYMNHYTRTSDIIATRPLTKEIKFALLHLDPLARALQEMARVWVTSLGRRLHNTAAGGLLQLDLELKVTI